MRKILFIFIAFEQYNNWQVDNKQVFSKLKKLIKEIVKIFFGGVGKFEVLKYSYIGYWFCRIIDEYRFVYKVEELWIEIIFCKFHYK